MMMIRNCEIKINYNGIIAGATASGSMRIGVIEEVDEQMTLTSLRQSNDNNRPHVQNIFAQGPPPPSDPVDVPGPTQFRNREVFSRSAPARGGIPTGNESGTVRERSRALRLVI